MSAPWSPLASGSSLNRRVSEPRSTTAWSHSMWVASAVTAAAVSPSRVDIHHSPATRGSRAEAMSCACRLGRSASTAAVPAGVPGMAWTTPATVTLIGSPSSVSTPLPPSGSFSRAAMSEVITTGNGLKIAAFAGSVPSEGPSACVNRSAFGTPADAASTATSSRAIGSSEGFGAGTVRVNRAGPVVTCSPGMCVIPRAMCPHRTPPGMVTSAPVSVLTASATSSRPVPVAGIGTPTENPLMPSG